MNRSWFSGKLFTTKLVLLFCFGSCFQVEIASFINSFTLTKSISSSFGRSWCTFSGVTINANLLLLLVLLIKSILTKQFCLRYCVDLKPRSLYRSSSVVWLCKFPINNCFYPYLYMLTGSHSDLYLKVLDLHFFKLVYFVYVSSC